MVVYDRNSDVKKAVYTMIGWGFTIRSFDFVFAVLKSHPRRAADSGAACAAGLSR